MKKVVLILVLCLLVSFMFYSCDKNELENLRYIDNKLIEGTWYGIYGKDSTIYTFKDNKVYHELYAFIQGIDTLKNEGKEDYGSYQLTDSLILMSSPTDFRFIYQLKNKNDSLYIRNPIDKPILWVGLKRLKK